MPSAEDTARAINEYDLVPFLILMSYQKDQALTFKTPSQHTRGLAWYHTQLHKALREAAFKAAFSREIANQVSQLRQQAETATIEEKKLILEQAKKLKEIMDKLND